MSLKNIINENVTKYSVFSISGTLYALEMSMIREVVRSPRVARLPNADSHILGVYNLRGRIITLVDIRQILGIAPAENDSTTLVLLIGTNGSSISFLVDKIHEFVEIDQTKIENLKIGTGISSTAYFQGEYKHDELGALMLIDARRLVKLD